jgi:hypothetical protein
MHVRLCTYNPCHCCVVWPLDPCSVPFHQAVASPLPSPPLGCTTSSSSSGLMSTRSLSGTIWWGNKVAVAPEVGMLLKNSVGQLKVC